MATKTTTLDRWTTTSMKQETRIKALTEYIQVLKHLLRECDPHLELIEESSDEWTEKQMIALRAKIKTHLKEPTDEN